MTLRVLIMQITKIAPVLGLVVMLCATLASCMSVSGPHPISAVAIATPPVALTPEAAEALVRATQKVEEAKQQKVLWISAAQALEQAQAAAQRMDSDATVQFAHHTIELCSRSLNQIDYPAVILN